MVPALQYSTYIAFSARKGVVLIHFRSIVAVVTGTDYFSYFTTPEKTAISALQNSTYIAFSVRKGVVSIHKTPTTLKTFIMQNACKDIPTFV